MDYGTDQFNEELMHYGVLGMRWGHRKAPLRSGGTHAQRKALSKKLYDESRAEYKKSQMARMEAEWRKKNPNADDDDFGDYLVDKPSYSEEKDAHFMKSHKLRSDAHKLSTNYVKDQVIGSVVMSALLTAPVAGLVTKKITGSGKFGALSALGVIGGSSIFEFMEATKDQRKTYDRYKDRG